MARGVAAPKWKTGPADASAARANAASPSAFAAGSSSARTSARPCTLQASASGTAPSSGFASTWTKSGRPGRVGSSNGRSTRTSPESSARACNASASTPSASGAFLRRAVPSSAASASMVAIPSARSVSRRAGVMPSTSERSPARSISGTQTPLQRQASQCGVKNGSVSSRPATIASARRRAASRTCAISPSANHSRRPSAKIRKPRRGAAPVVRPSSQPA